MCQIWWRLDELCPKVEGGCGQIDLAPPKVFVELFLLKASSVNC